LRRMNEGKVPIIEEFQYDAGTLPYMNATNRLFS